MDKKPVNKVTFPNSIYESWNGAPSHEELIESLGVEIFRKKIFGGPSGDLVMILKDTYSNNMEYCTRYGFLTLGFGSCGGCDALLACNSFKDLEELRDQYESQIKWFDSDMKSDGLSRLKNWMINEHDWSGDYLGNEIGDCQDNKSFGEKLFHSLMEEEKDA